MNVKQLIEKYENILKESVPFTVVNIYGVLRDLKQLDEPQKVVVPQFVADWIEEVKSAYTLFAAMEYGNLKIDKWLDNNSNQETFALAWIFGYEVEKEPKYIVKLKGVVRNSTVLKHNINEDTWYMSNNKTNYTDLKSYHTKKQLEEAGFGEVFNSTLFEVEEVGE